MPRKKRPRDIDNDSPDISPSACPHPSRNIAGTRRVSTSLPSCVQQRQQLPNFSLPMHSNELGRLPVYGQFQFSDSVPFLPVQSLDVDLNSSSMGTLYDMQGAYATKPLFEGQMMGNLVDPNPGTPETPSDFATPYTGDAFDIDILSSFGATPAMDDTTMAVWSAAPTNFECVCFLFHFSSEFLSDEPYVCCFRMEDWRSYIHSIEQMTQAQPI